MAEPSEVAPDPGDAGMASDAGTSGVRLENSLASSAGDGGLELPVNAQIAARFLGVSPSLVYAYVERKQIPHYRMMGRAIRFRLSELATWRQQFHVNGGIDE
jgi:excisionase family DNA binding protein